MEPVLSSTTRRRGHQHHPRHATRRRLDQSLLTTTAPSSTASSTPDRGPAQCGPVGAANDATLAKHSTESSPESTRLQQPSLDQNFNPSSPKRVVGASRILDKLRSQNKLNCDSKVVVIQDERPAQCGQDDNQQESDSKLSLLGSSFSDDEDFGLSPEFEHAVARAQGDGDSDEEAVIVEEDPEFAELARLRCPSERAEVQAEREARRRKRCADYPGLAFGCSIFSSDTMMKFSLIRNELQNIMGNQLKRVSILVLG